MKVGIVTLERYWMLRNYGTLLQCYALQTVLRRMGHEPVLVQRLHAREERRRWDFMWLTLHFCAHPVSAWAEWRSQSRFRRFMREHITATETCYREEALAMSPPAADAFICGSDQVWSKCGETAFLSFAPRGRRIAYAPSAPWANCGDAWKAQAMEFLPGFAGVSVREDAGAELLGGLGINAMVVADPVLLLEREDYAELMPPSRHRKPYMLVYTLNLPSLQDIFWDEVKQYAAGHHLDMVVVALQGAEKHFPASMLSTPAPGELLRLFADAACVVTNSFHGSAFSLLFGKPFASIAQRGSTASQNPRFHTLLAHTGQQHRLLQAPGRLPELLQQACSEAAPALQAWREQSLQYLQTALQGAQSRIAQ
ncbi:MAG: polysaccharide pyruvyl transferase family protein [Akkermansia sp.]|nr:polysaccharide pyruvyl transferase family protein [Akkermansia sp.]